MFIDIADYSIAHQPLLQPKGYPWTYVMLGIAIGGSVLQKNTRIIVTKKIIH
jgi:hypothetical protein